MATPISSEVLNQEADARFWAQTGYKPGRKLDPSNPTDKKMEPVWMDIFRKVQSEARAGRLVTTYDHPRVTQALSDAEVADRAAAVHVAAAAETPNPALAQDHVAAATTAVQVSAQRARDAASDQPPTVDPEMVQRAGQEAAGTPPPPEAPPTEHIAHAHARNRAHSHARGVHSQAREALYKETNRRFWDQTHYKPGQNLDMSNEQDRKMSKVWLDIFHQVQSEAAGTVRSESPPPSAPSPAPPTPPTTPPTLPPSSPAPPPPSPPPPGPLPPPSSPSGVPGVPPRTTPGPSSPPRSPMPPPSGPRAPGPPVIPPRPVGPPTGPMGPQPRGPMGPMGPLGPWMGPWMDPSRAPWMGPPMPGGAPMGPPRGQRGPQMPGRPPMGPQMPGGSPMGPQVPGGSPMGPQMPPSMGPPRGPQMPDGPPMEPPTGSPTPPSEPAGPPMGPTETPLPVGPGEVTTPPGEPSPGTPGGAPSPPEESSGVGKYIAIGLAVVAAGGALYYASTRVQSQSRTTMRVSTPRPRARKAFMSPRAAIPASPARARSMPAQRELEDETELEE